MQGVARSLGSSLGVLNLFSRVCFSILISVSGLHAAAAAEEVYPADESIVAGASIVLEHFRGLGGRTTSDYNFRYCELYRGLGANYNAPKDEITAKGRMLINRYDEASRVNRVANHRLRFIMNALAILTRHRREYNTLLYQWMHPDSSLDNPDLIAFVNAYTLVDRK